MAIPRISGAAPELEIYPLVSSQLGEHLERSGRPLLAELGDVEGGFVDACLGGVRVEVEGAPGGGEGVGGGGVCSAEGGYGGFEALFPDVAPGADGVGYDVYGEVGHVAEGGVESQGEEGGSGILGGVDGGLKREGLRWFFF